MRKLALFMILLGGMILPFACSDNNSPSKPSGASFGAPTPTPPAISTPGTATPVPTYALATPVYLNNYVCGASPNAMVYVAGQVLVAEGEVTLGGDITALGAYTVGGGGTLNGSTGGNAITIGFPTPNATPPWAGSQVVLTKPLGFVYSPPTNSYAILDGAPGSSGATLYLENPTYSGQDIYSMYGNSYGGAAFKNPTGLAVDSHGNLFVADSGNSAVEAFKPSAFNPSPPPALGIEHIWFGSNQVPFSKPYALTCDPNDNLWVADPGYSPSIIQEFSPYNALGDNGTTFIGAFNTLTGCVAHGIAVDQSLNCNGVPGPCVYVADVGNHMVEEYTSNGTLLRAWTVPVGSYEYSKFLPTCILVIGNPVSNIIVGDVGNDLLEVFGP